MADKSMDKTLQHGNWSMNNDLTVHTLYYGVFDAYVIRHVKALTDQGPRWTGGVPEYLTHFFLSLLVQRHQSLQNIQEGNATEQEVSIWTTSDVNAYHKARARGNLQLHLLNNGRLVSSTVVQNPNPHYVPHRFLSDGGIIGDCELNITISDTVNPPNALMLLPQDNGSFDINHLTVE